MSPEAREKLKEIVRELIKHIELPETFPEFLANSSAERNGDSWTVYMDGENRSGKMTAEGNTEYEAKENAWAWFQSIIEECKNTE